MKAKIKAITEFNEAVYKDIIIVKKGGCTSQTVTLATAGAYPMSSAKLTAGTPVNSDNVATFFTNSDATLCPTKPYTLLQEDRKSALSAG